MKMMASACAPRSQQGRAPPRAPRRHRPRVADRAVGERALVDLEAQVAVGDRREVAPQAPGAAAVAPAHLQHVAEAARGDDADLARPCRSSSALVPTVVPCTIERDRRGAAERAQAVEEAGRLVAAAATAPWRCGSARVASSNRNRSVKVPPTSTPTMTTALMRVRAQASSASTRHPQHDRSRARRLARHVAEPHVARDARGVALGADRRSRRRPASPAAPSARARSSRR